MRGLTYAEIGKKYNVTRQRIQSAIAPPKAIKKFVADKTGGCCEICGIQLNGHGDIHHVGGKDYDYNDINNLRYLCRACHMQQHSTMQCCWWTDGTYHK